MRVVVLMGGRSSERNVSLATGRGVAEALAGLGHEVLAIDAADGKQLPWDQGAVAIGEAPPLAHESKRGLALFKAPELSNCDVVFVALHGGEGEDGTLQAVLDLTGIPYTGSGLLACALAMDKTRAKTMLEAHGVPTPPGRLLKPGESAADVLATHAVPCVIKPNAEGSSVGVHVIEKDEDVSAALQDAYQYGDVMVETFIPGREITVAVLDERVFPVVEIETKSGFYDYRRKYTPGHTHYHAPADLPPAVASKAQELARKAYDALGCAGVARVDFRLNPSDELFCLEVNTVPGMTESSLVPMAAKEAGLSYEALVEEIVLRASRASA